MTEQTLRSYLLSMYEKNDLDRVNLTTPKHPRHGKNVAIYMLFDFNSPVLDKYVEEVAYEDDGQLYIVVDTDKIEIL